MKKLLLITTLILFTIAVFSQRNISVIRVSTDTVKATSATKTLSLKDTIKIDYADIVHMLSGKIDSDTILGKNIGTPERCIDTITVKTAKGCGGNTVLFNTGITVEDSLIYNNSPANGYVLTSDANGLGTWQAPITELLTFDVTIPHDSILIMNTRPQELIPAPGANKFIVPVSIAAYYFYNGVAYATNTNVSINYNITDWTGPGFLDISSTASLINFGNKDFFLINKNATDYINQNLNIQVGAGNPTDGTAGNYIRVKGKYYIEDFN